MELKPQEAARKLMENVKKIDEMTQKVIASRSKFALAEATLIEAKADSLKDSRGVSATAAQNQQSIDTVAEKQSVIMADAELKNNQDLLNVLETGNNNFKMAIRLMEMEVKNLNLT